MFPCELESSTVPARGTSPPKRNLGSWTGLALVERHGLMRPLAPQPDQRDLHPRGPALAPGRNLVRCAGRSRLREKKGAIEQLYTAPPTGSVVICLDEI